MHLKGANCKGASTILNINADWIEPYLNMLIPNAVSFDVRIQLRDENLCKHTSILRRRFKKNVSIKWLMWARFKIIK